MSFFSELFIVKNYKSKSRTGMLCASKQTSLPLGVILTSSLLAVGCASTGNIVPQYVAPSTYQSYDCAALNQEYNRIANYITQAQRQQSSITTTGVGVGVSAGNWGISPHISIGLGKSSSTQAQDANLARLFGERDAVVQSARLKQCVFATGLKTYGEK